MIEPGQPAPDFALESDTGETIRLSDLRGGPVVVYFYPKDETSGCTTQACGIGDTWGEFKQAGVELYGVSPDSIESHTQFREKYSLPFPLLADPDHSMADAFGVWTEKTNYGKTYWGIERSAFVIDADGNLAAVKHNVKADRHCEWALAELAKLAHRTPAG